MSTKLLALFPLSNDQIDILKQYDVAVIKPEELLDSDYAKIQIVYGWKEDIVNQIMDTPNHQLKWVQAYSAGVDYMPLEKLSKNSIILTNASGQRATPIAETVLSYIFHFARGLNVYQTRHTWQPFENQFTLKELPVVIFGTGHIGQQIATYLHAFGTTVYGVNTSGRSVPNFDKTFALNHLEKLPTDIEIVIDALPGTPETNFFFNDEHLSLFEHLFLFVNIGRGTTVDQSSLLSKLNDGHILHAALDVTTPEPIPEDSNLWHQDNLLLTQHTSWAGKSVDLFEVFMKNLPDFINHKSLTNNLVDYTRGY